jgi:uncharacterized RDD family membrane protein YckC
LAWYTQQDGVQQGPFEERQVREWASAGALRPDALVWGEGAAGWRTVAEVWGPGEAGGPQRRCGRCGTMYPERWVARWGEMEVCAYCKPRHVAALREGRALAASHGEFAGFGVRFAARMIDGVIQAVLNFALQVPMLVLVSLAGKGAGAASEQMAGKMAGLYGLTFLLQMGVQCAYEVWFLTAKGGTPGKLMLQLQVLDSEGKRLGRRQALGRYFGHFLTSLTMGVGYLMPLWDSEKRALHDMVADTRVMKQ